MESFRVSGNRGRVHGYRYPVPSNPLLAGSEVHWQVARFDPGTGEITLTNSVVSHFER
ncbi:MAG TPA: hypothetical protein VFD82_20475 [Planctomycetota bacterium]|nr:hypothetical protein [Planctomycetota bacterium]